MKSQNHSAKPAAKPAAKPRPRLTRPAALAAKHRSTKRPSASPATAPKDLPANTKQSRLIQLLRRADGVTIEQMTSLTGWQPHTVRGTISGVLRKRLGLNVACAVPADGGPRRYRIEPAA